MFERNIVSVIFGGALSLAAATTVGVIAPGVQSPAIGTPFVTQRGPALVTGTLGSVEATTMPGIAGQGLLFNNGNGTSTLIMPGGSAQTVPTPK